MAEPTAAGGPAGKMVIRNVGLMLSGDLKRPILDADTLIAFEMNGEPLSRWNGAPAWLVVPGWTATYWVKALTELRVLDRPFDGFWRKTSPWS